MNRIILTSPIYIEGRDCGYCHGKKEERYATEFQKTQASPVSKSITMGAQVEYMTCGDYDELMNMGFRRSGSFVYKTDMLRNCCRYYTIRTNLQSMKTEKKHRQVINRFVKHIAPDMKIPENKPFDVNVLLEAERSTTRFTTRFEPSRFSKEKFELYKKYQVSVHNDDPDDVSPEQFTRFLCNTPFEDEVDGVDEDEWSGLQHWLTKEPSVARVGPTHECYYMDDKLIAISVMDFLPSGISSVYFIWDPDYAHLSLGTVSGLRELLMVQQMGLAYYYLGYYIEDCVKMVYKGKFGGELLDVHSQQYYPLSQVKNYITHSRLFAMGHKGDTKEQFLQFEFPSAGTDPDNVVDDIYTQETEDEAHRLAAAVYDKLGIRRNGFPDVVPGLMPISQLSGLIDDPRLQQPVALFQVSKGGVEYKPLRGMNEREKVAVVNCVRMFGVERLQRLLIIMY